MVSSILHEWRPLDPGEVDMGITERDNLVTIVGQNPQSQMAWVQFPDSQLDWVLNSLLRVYAAREGFDPDNYITAFRKFDRSYEEKHHD
jgi:hypothetical protein